MEGCRCGTHLLVVLDKLDRDVSYVSQSLEFRLTEALMQLHESHEIFRHNVSGSVESHAHASDDFPVNVYWDSQSGTGMLSWNIFNRVSVQGGVKTGSHA